ncbi:helix-turn-helix transcriptional regulator [Nocardioides sp.]|uniref:helix-turn-helix domain-containing protein n=1 Tax=Nocardioides sp. TaxID=35761 RepID=UPI0026115143|nr:helix-turn-helix transcriptional regulator [Nocardioides sp.]
MGNNTHRQIAANINALLGLADWKKSHLSRATGITEATISRKMRGMADWSITDLDKIADVLNVTTVELIGTPPTATEWDRRRTAVPAAPGPRFLLSPTGHFDAPPAPLSPVSPTSDIMSTCVLCQ